MSVPLKATPTTFPHVLRFDGVDDVVAFPSAYTIPASKVFAVRTTVQTRTQTLQILCASKTDVGSASNSGFALFIENGLIRTSIASGGNQARRDTTLGVLKVNTYQDILAVFDIPNSNIKIYVDGELATMDAISGTYPTGAITGSTVLRLGSDNGARRFFAGDMLKTQLMVLDTAPTDTEVLNMYLYDTIPAGVTNYFDRISDAGTLLLDSVAGNNGTITGATRLTSLFGIPKPRKTIVPYVGSLRFDGVNDVVTGVNVVGNEPHTLVLKFTTPVATFASTDSFKIFNQSFSWFAFRDGNFRYGTGNNTNVSTPVSSSVLNRIATMIGTYDGTTMKLYVDGVLVSSLVTSLSATTNPAADIGSLGAAPSVSRWLQANIFDCKVYATALTTAEVETLVTHNVTPYDTDPTICKLNLETTAGQVDGAVWYDKTANKNNGTISGAVLV